MRRSVVGGIAAILFLFLGSLVLLDQFAAAPPGPDPLAPPSIPGHPAETPRPPSIPIRALEPRPVPAEVVAQLAAPPSAPAPAEPPAQLPPSGAPPAPAFVRESLGAVEARIVSRCGRMSLRLGDQLRKDRLEPQGHAVLLLEIEPQDDKAKVLGSTVQSYGTTRQSLVACAQLTLRGLVIPISYLRTAERVKVQVVLGVE
jgi:hypothetical protein